MAWYCEETASLRTNTTDEAVISSILNLQAAGSVSAAR
jgi:hypothetical protein